MSILADMHFSAGLEAPDLATALPQFQRASSLFPLNYRYRRGVANIAILYRDQAIDQLVIGALEQTLATDPHSADLLSFLWQYGTWTNDHRIIDKAIAGFNQLPHHNNG